MSFTPSPGVTFREIGVQGSLRQDQSSIGAYAGQFHWGPVGTIETILDENDLADRFGKPDNQNYIDFFTPVQFLQYSSPVKITRIEGDSLLNADTQGTGVLIKNEDDYEDATLNSAAYIARYPGTRGNSLAVSTATSASEFRFSSFDGTFTVTVGSKDVTYSPGINDTFADFEEIASKGDLLTIDGARYTIASVSVNDIKLTRTYNGTTSPTNFSRVWRFASRFGEAPGTDANGNDRFHVVVIDQDGEFTGESGTILEVYENLSKQSGVFYANGTTAYWKDALKQQSVFIWAGGIADILTVNSTDKAEVKSLSGGADQPTYDLGDYLSGYDLFENEDEIEADLFMTGEPNAPGSTAPTKASYVVENITSKRRDSVAFISPRISDVVDQGGGESDNITEDLLPALGSAAAGKIGSYGVLDNNWKYIYDRYNDTFRWVPLNGDIAGLTAQVDRIRAPWYSPAGFTRGQVRNVVKLAWNPRQEIRDELYPLGVNPVANIRGRGTVLFGDKTLGERPFDRINIRRLFIVVEQTVVDASRDLLFEFNDEFTRAQFVALVNPFLERIQGDRGIIQKQVIAGESLNTPQVVGNNQFVGQVYITPAESINFIRIDFINVESGIDFQEVVGEVA